jgi:hypothetical protein
MSPYTIESTPINVSKRKYIFLHSPLYCEKCGHVWNSAVPTEQQLHSYYCDQILHCTEDYSPDHRIYMIDKILNMHCGQDIQNNPMLLLDYGSNKQLAFHEKLIRLGMRVFTFDIVDTAQCIPNVDIVTSYFMLEHARTLDEHFSFFNDKLNKDGILIIEVPDSRIYDYDYSGLLYEHQHHFQPSSLNEIALRHNFYNIYLSSRDCSRKFGFLSVYTKHQDKRMISSPVEDVRSKYIAGRRSQSQESTVTNALAEAVSSFLRNKNIKSIYFWGINEYYVNARQMLMDEDRLMNSNMKFFAIDINPEKKNHVLNGDTYIHADDSQDHFMNNSHDSVLIITAVAHREQILNSISFDGVIFIFNPFDRQNMISLLNANDHSR